VEVPLEVVEIRLRRCVVGPPEVCHEREVLILGDNRERDPLLDSAPKLPPAAIGLRDARQYVRRGLEDRLGSLPVCDIDDGIREMANDLRGRPSELAAERAQHIPELRGLLAAVRHRLKARRRSRSMICSM
jgi:hypothetical protein